MNGFFERFIIGMFQVWFIILASIIGLKILFGALF